MSKLIGDLVNEFHSLDEIEDDFGVFVMNIIIDENGEMDSTESIEPVNRIEIDNENQECIFHLLSDGKPMNIAKVIKEISSENFDYALGSAEETSLDDSQVRIDNAIIGFGENIEQRRFFVVCKSYQNNDLLH